MLKPLPISSRRPLSPVLVLLIPILAVGLYFRAIDYPLMRPARVVTEYNGPVNGGRPWSMIWTEPTAAHPPGTEDYQPMRQLFLWLEWRAWGPSASSFHAMNLLLFLGVLMAFLFFAGRLIAGAGGRAVAGLVFAAHPLATQGVLGIEGQGTLLAMLATLLACLEFLRWQRTAIHFGRTCTIVSIGFLVAVGAHPAGLLLPLWILALALMGPSRDAPRVNAAIHPAPRKAKTALSEKPAVEPRRPPSAAWLALPLLLIVLIYLAIRHGVLGGVLPPRLVSPASAPAIFLHYLVRLVFPATPTLVYGVEAFSAAKALLGAVFLLALVAAAFFAARRRHPVAVGLALLVTSLLGLSHLVPLRVFMTEGALLFALPGLALVVGALFELAAGNESVFPPVGARGRALAACVAILTAALAWQTSSRAALWANEQTLWEAETRLHPDIAFPEIELMGTYGRSGDRERMLASAARARSLASDPGEIDRIAQLEARFYAAEKNAADLKTLLERELDSDRPSGKQHLHELATIAEAHQFNELAEELWRKALTIDPDFFPANYNLAQIEFTRNNIEAAFDFAENAARHASRSQRPLAFIQYAEVLFARGNRDEAAIQFEQALQLDPTIYMPYVRLMQVHWARKDYLAAERVMMQALQQAKVASFVDLATIYVSMLNEDGRLPQAMALLGQMIQRYPSDMQLRLLAADVYVQLGDYSQATRLYQTLTNLSPKQQAEANVGLGVIALEGNQNRVQAEKFWRQALALDPRQQEARRRLVALGINPDAPAEN